jgi:hypothetical protein
MTKHKYRIDVGLQGPRMEVVAADHRLRLARMADQCEKMARDSRVPLESKRVALANADAIRWVLGELHRLEQRAKR